jgi:anaerobic ribonucleoside-triphosphate reductase
MGVSYGSDRGKLGYSMRTRQLRRCNECGYTANVLYNTHKIWTNGKSKYCGYMRVVNDEQ